MTLHRMKESHNGYAVVTTCSSCEKRLDGRLEPVFADLDAEAGTYYCGSCAARLLREKEE